MMRRTLLVAGLLCTVLTAGCGPDAEVEPIAQNVEKTEVAERPAGGDEGEGDADGGEGGLADSSSEAAMSSTEAAELADSETSEAGSEDATSSEDATPADASALGPGTVDQVRIFLIDLEGAGGEGREIGCGDRVIGVLRDIEPTAAPLGAAFELLLSLEERDYGESGFVTVLGASELGYEGATIEAGTARVALSGDLVLGGVCDGPRVKAQLEETALQFDTVDAVEILIDGVPLDDLLSQEG